MTDNGKPDVFAAINAVMRDVQAVRKGERNGHGGFMFRGIDAVTNAVGPALREHGVIVVPEVIDETFEMVTIGGNRTLMARVSLRVRFRWYGPAGDYLDCVTQGEAFDSGDKATAKAHSVAFRTAMIQTLALPTDEPDPDAQTYEAAPVDVDALVQRIESADYSDLGAIWREAGHLRVLDDPRVRAAFDRRRTMNTKTEGEGDGN